jgi:hypothetical protein
MGTTGKEIAEHVIRATKLIPTCHVKGRHEQLLIIIHRLSKVQKKVQEREKSRESRIIGNRMILE